MWLTCLWLARQVSGNVESAPSHYIIREQTGNSRNHVGVDLDELFASKGTWMGELEETESALSDKLVL